MKEELRALPFDEVVITAATGECRYDIEGFLRLPTHERIGCILNRRLRFRMRGEAVDSRVALQALRTLVPLPSERSQ